LQKGKHSIRGKEVFKNPSLTPSFWKKKYNNEKKNGVGGK